MLILTLTPKEDFEVTRADVRKINSQISDLDYALQNLTAKVGDVESRAETFSNFQRLENQKFIERIEKLEAGVAQIRNIIGKISEQLKGGMPNLDQNDSLGVSSADLEKLKE